MWGLINSPLNLPSHKKIWTNKEYEWKRGCSLAKPNENPAGITWPMSIAQLLIASMVKVWLIPHTTDIHLRSCSQTLWHAWPADITWSRSELFFQEKKSFFYCEWANDFRVTNLCLKGNVYMNQTCHKTSCRASGTFVHMSEAFCSSVLTCSWYVKVKKRTQQRCCSSFDFRRNCSHVKIRRRIILLDNRKTGVPLFLCN